MLGRPRANTAEWAAAYGVDLLVEEERRCRIDEGLHSTKRYRKVEPLPELNFTLARCRVGTCNAMRMQGGSGYCTRHNQLQRGGLEESKQPDAQDAELDRRKRLHQSIGGEKDALEGDAMPTAEEVDDATEVQVNKGKEEDQKENEDNDNNKMGEHSTQAGQLPGASAHSRKASAAAVSLTSSPVGLMAPHTGTGLGCRTASSAEDGRGHFVAAPDAVARQRQRRAELLARVHATGELPDTHKTTRSNLMRVMDAHFASSPGVDRMSNYFSGNTGYELSEEEKEERLRAYDYATFISQHPDVESDRMQDLIEKTLDCSRQERLMHLGIALAAAPDRQDLIHKHIVMPKHADAKDRAENFEQIISQRPDMHALIHRHILLTMEHEDSAKQAEHLDFLLTHKPTRKELISQHVSMEAHHLEQSRLESLDKMLSQRSSRASVAAKNILPQIDEKQREREKQHARYAVAAMLQKHTPQQSAPATPTSACGPAHKLTRDILSNRSRRQSLAPSDIEEDYPSPARSIPSNLGSPRGSATGPPSPLPRSRRTSLQKLLLLRPTLADVHTVANSFESLGQIAENSPLEAPSENEKKEEKVDHLELLLTEAVRKRRARIALLHSAENGGLYMLGKGKVELGLGPKIVDLTVPRFMRAMGRRLVVQVACGSNHTVARDESGYAFAWGANDCGQLGLGDTADRPAPYSAAYRESPLFKKKVSWVACGDRASAFIVRDQEKNLSQVFMCGDATTGMIGIGKTEAKCFTKPAQVTVLDNKQIHTLSIGFDHCAAVADCGDLYTWGCGDSGQCGLGNKLTAWEPVLVPNFLDMWADVECGHKFTFATGFDGNVYSWGLNDVGQLGQGSFKQIASPQPVMSLWRKGTVLVTCSMRHATALNEDGEVSSFCIRPHSFYPFIIFQHPNSTPQFSMQHLLKQLLYACVLLFTLLPIQIIKTGIQHSCSRRWRQS